MPCRRALVAGAPPTPRQCHTDASASQLERLAVFLGDNYRDPLNAADVGRALGLHPNDATTLFRRGLGVGM
jgi:hypothetical protein